MTGPSGRRQLVTVGATYAAYFAASGFHQPFFPLWLQHNGLTAGEVAIVLSLPAGLRILVVAGIGRLADRLGEPGRLFRILTVAFLAFAVVLGRLDRFGPILVVSALMMVAWQGASPLLDATAVNLVRRGIASDFGRLRLWGSISFIGASVAGGHILAAGGPDAVFLGFTVAAGGVMLAGLAVGRLAAAPRPAVDAGEPTAAPGRLGFLAMLLAAALIQASHMAFNGFGSIHLARLGHAETTIGLMWAIAAAAEIGMFWAGPQIARRMTPRGVLAVAAAVAALRWGLLALEPGFGGLVLLQLTQAVTFSGTYLGLMRYIAGAAGERRAASAQGTYTTLLGLVSAGAMLVFGRVYQSHGAAVFLVAAVMPILAFAILVVLPGRGAGHQRKET